MAASITLSELLRLLPTSARDTLVAHLRDDDSDDHGDSALPAGRLACRALRDFIDGEVEQLDLDCSLEPAELGILMRGGRWLERWPRCKRLTITVDDARLDALSAPIATASLEACRRIQELEVWVRQVINETPPLPSGTLVALLSRLPGLHTLTLEAKAPQGEQEQSVARHALSLLPKLTSLTVGDYGYLACIPEGLARQLTSLAVDSEQARPRPPLDDIFGCLAPMASLRRLSIHATVEEQDDAWYFDDDEWEDDEDESCDRFEVPWREDEVLELLDYCAEALPRLKSVDVWPVGHGYVDVGCTLAGGVLKGVKLWAANGLTCGMLYRICAEVVLPCDALGPRRLPRLELRAEMSLAIDEEEEDGLLDDLAEIFTRFDRVSISTLEVCSGCSALGALSFIRLMGLPPRITCGGGYNITLRRRRRSAALSGGADRAGSSADSAPVPPALTAWQVEQPALQRMLAAAGGAKARCVVLTGPLVRRLLADTAALVGWVGQVQREASSATPRPPVSGFVPLAASGAVLLECNSGTKGLAVAAAALRLAAAGPQASGMAVAEGTGGGAEAEPVLEARLSALRWGKAVRQVLQAWWDGEEQGGAGGAAAPSGSGGGGRAPWPQLERALRAFIDDDMRELDLDCDLELAELGALARDGRWLERWSLCRRVKFKVGNDRLSALAIPFATALIEACRRIRELEVQAATYDTPVSSGTLIALLSRIPELTTLTLGTKAPSGDSERSVARHALSLLPKLTSLTVGDYGYLACIPDCLARQLTSLRVASQHRLCRAPTDDILTCLFPMGSLRCLAFHVNPVYTGSRWRAEEVLLLLDMCTEALPRLETLAVWPLGAASVDAALTFAGGALTGVKLTARRLSYGQLSSICTEVLLPCRALGPRRLPRLEVDAEVSLGPHRTPADEEDLDPNAPAFFTGPAAALLARCGHVSMAGLDLGHPWSAQAALSVMRLLGVPQRITWGPRAGDTCYGSITLRPPPAAPAAAARGSGGEDGADGSGDAPQPPPTALAQAQLQQRALALMVAAGAATGSVQRVVVTGPLVRRLLPDPLALRMWVGRVQRAAATEAEPRPLLGYRPLSAAGAVLLAGLTREKVEALAAATLRLAADAVAVSEGGEAAALLEACPSGMRWDKAVTQVLQAWWDGEEQGGAGGVAAPSGSGGGGRAPWPQLERVRLLLEMVEGIRGSVPDLQRLGRP
ncbi:hypothetical protein HYH03_010716 [Edaphochlamys debaryana]|uniref:Uncharacterized protein n=1 Tax=Edaphochlamys debaryana TaxID=47281 RepID=A0A836BX47_9CHLO|nr:hypothetical protein HYH03_010716 [Edaphochlamys debaryana]|eukprot:KAG2490794.1 hypothetical protein HYH03_010716 [Edaphochlamys debaryana]